MAAVEAKVLPFAPPVARETLPPPFVMMSVARQVLALCAAAHDERAIVVAKGPPGVGKTWALRMFADEADRAILVTVDPGSSKRGATAIGTMQLVAEALRQRFEGRSGRGTLSNAYWSMRKIVYDVIEEYYGHNEEDWEWQRLTLIFDEAQYLSREAIEMLRYWNDGVNSATPFPVGLVFVGNDEFSLQDGVAGESIISGAVRSRALAIETLEYADVADEDLALFLQSRGVADRDAIAEIARFLSSPRIPRDLRWIEQKIKRLKLRAGDDPITATIVRDVLAI